MQESPCKKELEACKEEIKRLKEELHKEMTHDFLTQLFNRRGLKEKCEYLIEVAKRDGSHLSVALVDIDHFDNVNTQRGYAKGDEILKQLSHVLQNNIRKVDVIGRFDGEEFVILMPNTNKEDAIMVSQRLRKNIDKDSLNDVDDLTVSCGVATIHVNLSDDTQGVYEKLHLKADEALYYAKKSGRNRVVHYDEMEYL